MWVTRLIGIASDYRVASFKDNEYMRNELKKYISSIDQTRIKNSYVELFDGYIGSGSDPSVTPDLNVYDPIGNPTSTDLENAINTGATIIEYIGHGTDTKLQTTNFDLTNVDNLHNTDKYFLFISVACLIGAFHNSDTLSLAEKFQIAENAGSIAVFASSVEQTWEEPKQLLSAINKLIQKSPEKNITIGELFFEGVTNDNFLHISLGGLNENDESYYYNLFGDPSTTFNLSKIEEQNKCFHWSNLQPLTKKQNLSKNCKMPSDTDIELHLNKIIEFCNIKCKDVKSIMPEIKGSISG